MQVFHAHIGQMLQGDFELKEINVAFVFQVNCPGCFMYGIPVMNELVEKYGEKIGFIGISTCFEDFDKNTSENTLKLLQQKEMVGETKKYFASNGVYNYPHPVNFSVAFDEIMTPKAYLTKENIELICKSNPNYDIWPEWEKKALQEKVIHYYTSFEFFGKTFTLNQLQGTPSFVVFDNNKEMKKSLFGYQSSEVISQIIDA
ncbi:MAG: TlpA family protein disulfide reductase [Saprospiraceae bacterium]|nr:TlpA family protein disulfide reductase [Saprospiraceae bacterium]